MRSVGSIIEELEILRKAAEADELSESALHSNQHGGEPFDPRPGRWVVKVVDDAFTVNRKRTLELLDKIIAAGLNCFEFTGGVHADTLDEVLVTKIREANFRRVTLGVESGSPRILKMIRKGETNEDVKRAITLLRGAGIRSQARFS